MDEINNSKIYYIEFNSSIVCDIAETCLINKYLPKCNKAKIVPDFDCSGICFDESIYSWKQYIFKNGAKTPNDNESIKKRLKLKAQTKLSKEDEIKNVKRCKIIIQRIVGKSTSKDKNYIIGKIAYYKLKDKLCKLCNCNHSVNWFLEIIKYGKKFKKIKNKEKYQLVKYET